MLAVVRPMATETSVEQTSKEAKEVALEATLMALQSFGGHDSDHYKGRNLNHSLRIPQ